MSNPKDHSTCGGFHIFSEITELKNIRDRYRKALKEIAGECSKKSEDDLCCTCSLERSHSIAKEALHPEAQEAEKNG